MSVSDRELLHYLSRMPSVDTAELAMILGEAHVAIHRGLAWLEIRPRCGVRKFLHQLSHLDYGAFHE